MSALRLTIKTDNAAFQDGEIQWELPRILRRIADQIEAGESEGIAMDVNGNTVGQWRHA